MDNEHHIKIKYNLLYHFPTSGSVTVSKLYYHIIKIIISHYIISYDKWI